jgi:hypothetical protein
MDIWGVDGAFVRGIFDKCPRPWSTPTTPFIPLYDGGALGGTMGSPISCLTRSASARFIIRQNNNQLKTKFLSRKIEGM